MSEKDRSIVLTNKTISLDVVKRAFVTEGMSIDEIAESLDVEKHEIECIINDLGLKKIRKTLVKSGIQKIESKQIDQAKAIMDLDLNFKKLRLIQLQKQLEDYAAYYAKYNDFYKRHPTTNKILKDSFGMPMQLEVPNVSREIAQLKDSLNLSQGLKTLLQQVEDILNTKKEERLDDADEGPSVIDVDAFFKKG